MEGEGGKEEEKGNGREKGTHISLAASTSFFFFFFQLKSLMDLTMMAFHPSHSRLRTQEELFFLLQQSGFADSQTYPTRASYSIVESFPSAAT